MKTFRNLSFQFLTAIVDQLVVSFRVCTLYDRSVYRRFKESYHIHLYSGSLGHMYTDVLRKKGVFLSCGTLVTLPTTRPYRSHANFFPNITKSTRFRPSLNMVALLSSKSLEEKINTWHIKLKLDP
jgi:hypothetical protein